MLSNSLITTHWIMLHSLMKIKEPKTMKKKKVLKKRKKNVMFCKSRICLLVVSVFVSVFLSYLMHRNTKGKVAKVPPALMGVLAPCVRTCEDPITRHPIITSRNFLGMCLKRHLQLQSSLPQIYNSFGRPGPHSKFQNPWTTPT